LYDALVYRLDTPDPSAIEEGGVTRPTKPYLMADRGWGHAGYPALSVSQNGAEAFCLWLSDKTGKQWRLPTVEEWTLLCETSGITSKTCDDHAWHAGNAKKKTHAIGSRQVDANGLHDLQGNVSEWCTTSEGGWVLMGGCYADAAGPVCSMQKVPVPAWNDTDPQIPKSIWWLSDAPFAGFRVVCDGSPPKTDELKREEEASP
jgi:formylglycine-generating enzyme required for sulfatase activity